jgi:two-component system CheB/CheR fusion protein
VVGIGASAGGLSALKTLLNHVPAESGLAFVVVVHLSPDHESHLAELLQPHVRFPVQQVVETTHLEPNRVYVIPPNANLSTIDTHLRLSQLEEQRRERAPIDHFFRTLARTHDGNGIAVVLTGTGTDGTLGVKDIKANGGLVIVQDPNEAEYDGMPQSAIATGLVDYILPLAQIPEHILRFNHTQPHLAITGESGEVNGDVRVLLQKVFAQLRARTDRDFSRYKRSTILRRIARRMQLNYLEDLPKYVDRLRERPEEVRALADDLLITVTHFFRDTEVFDKLKTEEIPRLFSNKPPQETIRVWSVGCATGEEAYSLAILLAEEASRQENPPPIQIFASDLHSRSLARAREGFYPGDIATDVGVERLKRFFEEQNGGYRIHKEIRDMVVFTPHNLLADPPFSRMDLISCRNLLIYLERDVQRDVIDLFHYALNPDGTLLLGSAETMDDPELFSPEDKRLCFFRKRNVPPREPRLPVFPLSVNRLHGQSLGAAERGMTPVHFGELHQEMVERYAPPSILIGPDQKLVHLSEHAGRYLIHPGGEPTQSVVRLVREELRIELQAALHSTRETREPHDSRPIMVRFNGHSSPVVMHLRPAPEPNREGYVLVIFEERASESAVEPAGPADFSADQRIRELEAEVTEGRQRMQTIIEEYETSREEMKASSEEMQSTNEELRSTMEELETSKEELQSINEELQTVNQQNRHKVEELSQLSSDLQNLLSATDIATLFLDRELRILRFTPKLSELFNVRPADRGRPISDLTNRLGYADLRQDSAAVLSRLIPIEREVQDDRERWYLTRVLPYRSTEDRIEGVVITFVDIDKRKRAEDALREREDRLRRMVNVEVVGVLITDDFGLITECNEAAAKMLGYSRDDIKSRNLTWLDITPPDDLPATRQQMAELIKFGRSELSEKEYVRQDGALSWMIFTAATLGDGTSIRYCLDVSDRKRAENQALEAERGLNIANHALVNANSDLKQFSYAVSHDMQEPLRMVTSYAQLLAREFRGKLDPRADQYIDFAVKGALQMEALLTDLREYWAVDEAKIEKLIPVDCNQAIQRAITYLESAIQESGAVISVDQLPTVRAEEYPVILLFQNLLGNGIKYRRRDTPLQIHVSAGRSADFWQFAITDNGIGIAADNLEVVFEPFKRLHGSRYPGTGLGLAMCRRVVARYRGKIWMESQLGEGSTVRFTLPAGE